jgi:uncharacterized protein Veg
VFQTASLFWGTWDAAKCGKRRTRQMQRTEIDKVRASVHQQCGSKVMIQLDRGRNKVDIQSGIIQGAYPSVFTVLVDDKDEKNPPQLLSFSYSDIITRDIRMKLC